MAYLLEKAALTHSDELVLGKESINSMVQGYINGM